MLFSNKIVTLVANFAILGITIENFQVSFNFVIEFNTCMYIIYIYHPFKTYHINLLANSIQ